MGELAFKLKSDTDKKGFSLKSKDLRSKILDSHTEEIIIGLCGPIGTDIHSVASNIETIISEKYDYTVIIIQLSDYIKKYKHVKEEAYTHKYDYINALITAGNEMRSTNGSSILAELAISDIAVDREKRNVNGDFSSKRVCYIIDSIKNLEELELFRLVYSNLFYFFGVFSNLDVREKYLDGLGISKYDIPKLIDRDSGEEKQFGQQVGDTFMQGDFFLRIADTTSSAIEYRITRYLNLIFGSEITTPTTHETAMYQAFAAAGNSACLSRQVGAAITNSKGDIISVGWNDVPKYLGGLYGYTDNNLLGSDDKRCTNINGGICHNDAEKELIRKQLVDLLIDKNIIKEEDRLTTINIIKNSRIKELIEFSRAVHAEMHALIIGSQKSGQDVIGGILYCTTYPCHNCARHIVAAGIKDVYYIEPYRKSLAIKLHSDAISEDEKDNDRKVRILMFDGVSPRRYLEFFKMGNIPRKENGKKKPVPKQTVYPRNTVSLQAIPILEKKIVEELQTKSLIKVPDEGQG